MAPPGPLTLPADVSVSAGGGHGLSTTPTPGSVMGGGGGGGSGRKRTHSGAADLAAAAAGGLVESLKKAALPLMTPGEAAAVNSRLPREYKMVRVGELPSSMQPPDSTRGTRSSSRS